MNRIASILLLCCFLGLGTGALEYAHNRQHAAEDALEDARAKAPGRPLDQDHHHDEGNCAVHAQLHAPLLTIGWVPFLVAAGLLVAFLSLLRQPLVHRAPPARIKCRGPPLIVPA